MLIWEKHKLGQSYQRKLATQACLRCVAYARFVAYVLTCKLFPRCFCHISPMLTVSAWGETQSLNRPSCVTVAKLSDFTLGGFSSLSILLIFKLIKRVLPVSSKAFQLQEQTCYFYVTPSPSFDWCLLYLNPNPSNAIYRYLLMAPSECRLAHR